MRLRPDLFHEPERCGSPVRAASIDAGLDTRAFSRGVTELGSPRSGPAHGPRAARFAASRCDVMPQIARSPRALAEALGDVSVSAGTRGQSAKDARDVRAGGAAGSRRTRLRCIGGLPRRLIETARP